MWNVKFLSEAEADMHSLDNSLKKQILKGIAKVSTNPLPIPTGYGKPLGNKGGNNLTRFFKIKYRGIGIRVVYTLVIEKKVMNIVMRLPENFIINMVMIFSRMYFKEILSRL